MNAENLRKTRALTIREPESYDQGGMFTSWGAPCCVAAYALLACEANPEGHEGLGREDQLDLAGQLLGLTPAQRDAMFAARPIHRDGYPFTPNTGDAVDMLDHAIEHDELVWR